MPARPPIEEMMAGREPTYRRPEVDCHIHTTASDGAWSPGEVVAQAQRRGLRVIAITDHDRVTGVPEALEAGAALGVTVVPAVELDTVDPGTGLSAEILGYDLDSAPAGLEQMGALCRWIARRRVERLEGLLARVREAYQEDELTALGQTAPGLRWEARPRLPLSLEAVLEVKLGRPVEGGEVSGLLEGVSLMLPDFCKFLLRGGFISPRSASAGEVKRAFFAAGRPLHVDFQRLSPQEAIGAIHACGGRAVLAHPGQVRDLAGSLQALAGVAGPSGWCAYGGMGGETPKPWSGWHRVVLLWPGGGSGRAGDRLGRGQRLRCVSGPATGPFYHLWVRLPRPGLSGP